MRSWAASGAVALLLSGAYPLTGVPAAAQVAVPVSPGVARIWFYRNYEPYGARNMVPVTLNGAVVGYAQPEGNAFYRDVPAGRYQVGGESIARDINLHATINLRPGDQAFVKILGSNTWESGGDTSMFNNDAFYVRLMPPQIAQAELSQAR